MDVPSIDSMNPDWRSLTDRAMEELRLKTEAHMGTWPLLESDWSVDQDEGAIVFTTDEVEAVAPVQIIGTYNIADETWLWGWANSSIVPELQRDALRLQQSAVELGFPWLAERKLACSEDEAWEMTAVACHFCGAQGAYRGPAGDTLIFMTFGNVTLQRR
jgi:hypothetical protein